MVSQTVFPPCKVSNPTYGFCYIWTENGVNRMSKENRSLGSIMQNSHYTTLPLYSTKFSCNFVKCQKSGIMQVQWSRRQGVRVLWFLLPLTIESLLMGFVMYLCKLIQRELGLICGNFLVSSSTIDVCIRRDFDGWVSVKYSMEIGLNTFASQKVAVTC